MTSIAPVITTGPPLAVVLISNGPGELATWVRPIAEKLHQEVLMQPRSKISSISLKLVLVPCPNGTGKEKEAATKWNQFDQITEARNFWKLLKNPKRYCDWPQEGIVIFLGGDQFWSILLSARLGYKNITYAEWIARWPRWNDKICAMSNEVLKSIPKKFQNKCKLVGDLMADLSPYYESGDSLPQGKWVALLPGSKKAKLCIGVPFMLEMADLIKKKIPDCKFLLPIAPTTSIKEIQELNGSENPISKNYKSKIKKLFTPLEKNKKRKLITEMGTEIYIEENSPAHLSLVQCELAITTIGANTSELGALGVPMIVIVPTQHLNVMKAWDGIIGLIARLPLLKFFLNFLIGKWRLRKRNLLAWPNISAGKMIVPERIGKIIPSEIAKEAIEWLQSPERLNGQKEDLRSLRGKPGAVNLMTKEILKMMKSIQKINF